ncbi:hypothetical protein PG984_003696 [Apiospora sp. TS-2023a]
MLELGYRGDGLATAFVAASYLTLGLLTTHYLIAYKPRIDAVDSVVLRWPRWCFHKLTAAVFGSDVGRALTSSGIASSLEEWIGMFLVNLADVQVLLGSKLLLELYKAVDAEISAAQWQFVMHLAWFPVIACMCSISVLTPPYSSSSGTKTGYAHEWPRLSRAVVLAALLGTTLVGTAPTLFFDWESAGRWEASAAKPETDARRFLFDFAGELERFGHGGVEGGGSFSTHGCQLAVCSVVALMSVAILVLEKAISAPREEEDKRDCPSQEKSSSCIDRCFGAQKVEADLEDLDDIDAVEIDLDDVEASLGLFDSRAKPKTFGAIFSDAASFFAKFNMDLLTSRFAEIFLLFVLQFWGMARLYGSIPQSRGQIPNGQALWSFSQELSLALLVVPFIVAINSYLFRDTSSNSSSSKCQYAAPGAGVNKAPLLLVFASPPSAASSSQQKGDDESAQAAGSEKSLESYPPPWMGVVLVCGSVLILGGTVAFFGTTFNMIMGLQPQFLVSEALFTQVGVFWVFFPGYPIACFATGLTAYAMERCWVHKRRSSSSIVLLDAPSTASATSQQEPTSSSDLRIQSRRAPLTGKAPLRYKRRLPSVQKPLPPLPPNRTDGQMLASKQQQPRPDRKTETAKARGRVEFSKWRVGDYVVLFVVGAAVHVLATVVILVNCL